MLRLLHSFFATSPSLTSAVTVHSVDTPLVPPYRNLSAAVKLGISLLLNAHATKIVPCEACDLVTLATAWIRFAPTGFVVVRSPATLGST